MSKTLETLAAEAMDLPSDQRLALAILTEDDAEAIAIAVDANDSRRQLGTH